VRLAGTLAVAEERFFDSVAGRMVNGIEVRLIYALAAS
jgi:hypothetical protein